MKNLSLLRAVRGSRPLFFLTQETFPTWLKKQSDLIAGWINAQGFQGKPGTFCSLPGAKGEIECILCGLSEPAALGDIADFARKLPEGVYHFGALWDGKREMAVPKNDAQTLALGWLLGGYRFTRYKKETAAPAQLVLPEGAEALLREAEAISLGRDLINTPAEDMGPAELAKEATSLAKKHKAKITLITGDALLKKNYPAIHAVGRASPRAPRLIDLTWGNVKHPRVTLVGKGVCFDTGGLDIKSSSGMALMKKDMGGAAVALSLASMIMANKLPVRLRVLIPAVENAIAGNAYRTSDIIKMRNGLTVEVGNTDGEGRLVLADALCEASSENPSLLLDFATLTGAARVAVGTEISALFSNDDDMANNLLEAGKEVDDLLWRMPLYAGYAKQLKNEIADISSISSIPYAGAITAALFLEKFVGKDIKWAHLDLMGWNLSSRPAHPQGGEPMAARAAFQYLQSHLRGKKR